MSAFLHQFQSIVTELHFSNYAKKHNSLLLPPCTKILFFGKMIVKKSHEKIKTNFSWSWKLNLVTSKLDKFHNDFQNSKRVRPKYISLII